MTIYNGSLGPAELKLVVKQFVKFLHNQDFRMFILLEVALVVQVDFNLIAFFVDLNCDS